MARMSQRYRLNFPSTISWKKEMYRFNSIGKIQCDAVRRINVYPDRAMRSRYRTASEPEAQQRRSNVDGIVALSCWLHSEDVFDEPRSWARGPSMSERDEVAACAVGLE